MAKTALCPAKRSSEAKYQAYGRCHAATLMHFAAKVDTVESGGRDFCLLLGCLQCFLCDSNRFFPLNMNWTSERWSTEHKSVWWNLPGKNLFRRRRFTGSENTADECLRRVQAPTAWKTKERLRLIDVIIIPWSVVRVTRYKSNAITVTDYFLL